MGGSYLSTSIAAGSTEIPVLDVSMFRVGDEVRIGGVDDRTIIAVSLSSSGRRRLQNSGIITINPGTSTSFNANTKVETTAKAPTAEPSPAPAYQEALF